MVIRECIEKDILRKRHPGRRCSHNAQRYPKGQIVTSRRVLKQLS